MTFRGVDRYVELHPFSAVAAYKASPHPRSTIYNINTENIHTTEQKQKRF